VRRGSSMGLHAGGFRRASGTTAYRVMCQSRCPSSRCRRRCRYALPNSRRRRLALT
jgi:hypothetical protein